MAKSKVQMQQSVQAFRPSAFGPISLFSLFALSFSLFSCAHPIQERRGRAGDVIAEQYGDRIEAILPPTIDVPTARAAAEQTLRARGYVITESSGTLDQSRVEASRVAGSNTTTFQAWRASAGNTRVRFSGDAAASRSMLDELIARLGR